MRKIFGIQAELNITTDDDLVKGIGKGISKGSITLNDIVNDVKPSILNLIRTYLENKNKDNSNKENNNERN